MEHQRPFPYHAFCQVEQGTYELEGLIGDGGMAEVFRGRKTGHGGWSRPVAIKRMYRLLSSDQRFSEMFIQEAHLAARLQHSNIVTVLDFARTEENELLLVMELVEGVDLHRVFEEGPVPPSIASFVIGEVLAALAYAHAARDENDHLLRLVHRDVTPHNVLLSWEGEVKLSDFGIAKLAESPNVTRTGTIKGKVAYLSPEQANTDPLDGRSDLFAVGIILHELLTGRRLFGVEEGARDIVIVHRVLNLPIESPHQINPEVPEALAGVCMKLLERNPDERYQSAAEARDALLDVGVVSVRGAQELAKHLHERFSTSTDTRMMPPPPASTGKPGQGTFTRALEAYEERKRATDSTFDEPLSTATKETSRATELNPRSTPIWPFALLLLLPLGIAILFFAEEVAESLQPPAPMTKQPAPMKQPVQPEKPAPHKPKTWRLSVASDPSGASVYLDNELRGRTPLVLSLAEREAPKAFEVRKDGYQIVHQEVKPGIDQHFELQLRKRVRRTKKEPRKADRKEELVKEEATAPEEPATSETERKIGKDDVLDLDP